MVDRSLRPLFLLSLPRAGSTLLQRLLAAHPAVATAAEPWLLIPLLYLRRSEGVYAEYNHRLTVQAVADFTDALPDGQQDMDAALREMVLGLYGEVSNEKPHARYFLDKTPRYHFVVDELISVFPDAAFVFLWRNPLAIAASMIDSLGGGKNTLYLRKPDLYGGMDRLLGASEELGSRALTIRYEDLVENPARQLDRIWGYLDLEPDPSVLERFQKVELEGQMGDMTGRYRYQRVSTASLTRWHRTLANPYRRAWARRYLNWLGTERLARMGYEKSALRAELDTLPRSWDGFASDLLWSFYGAVWSLTEPHMIKAKFRRLPDWYRIYGHS